jgi:nitroreductase
MPTILQALVDRRSERHFSNRPLEPEVVESLIEAFRWAPSSNNKQPWRLLIAKDAASIAAYDDALSEGNRTWATAAALKMVVVGNPDEQPDRNGMQSFMLDCGLALENLLIQGCALGLTTHAMIGWDIDKVTSAFAIPAPMRPVALVVAGYRGRIEDLPPDVQAKDLKPRTRKPAEEIVVWSRFG